MKKSVLLVLSGCFSLTSVFAANPTCQDLVGYWHGSGSSDLGSVSVTATIPAVSFVDGSGNVSYQGSGGSTSDGALNGNCTLGSDGLPTITLYNDHPVEGANYVVKMKDAHHVTISGRDAFTSLYSSTLSK